jgi:HJR/Mrr/RecB family endonuclease
LNKMCLSLYIKMCLFVLSVEFFSLLYFFFQYKALKKNHNALKHFDDNIDKKNIQDGVQKPINVIF